jgi:hypothetical protein
MSKNRNTKNNKKSLKNKSKNQLNYGKNSLDVFQRINQMFGNPDVEKFFNLTNDGSTEDIMNKFIEGEKEFLKVIESFKKKYVIKNLENLHKTNPEIYTTIIEIYLFTPYKKFGNKSKMWFNDFYEFISELPETVTLSKNEIIPVYRVMTKSEFLISLVEGVQNPSWTLDLGMVMRFMKKNLLTMDENIVVVKSIFSTDEVSFSPTEVISGESEIWIRKGSKSIRTFVIGEYTKSQFLTQFDDSKLNDTKLLLFRELTSGLNGFGTDESTDLRESMMSGSHDDLLYKFTKYDLPKLGRKLKTDRITKSLGIFNDSLQHIVNKQISSYELLCKGISPLTV